MRKDGIMVILLIIILLTGCLNKETESSIEKDNPKSPNVNDLELQIFMKTNRAQYNSSLEVELRLTNIGNESIQVEKMIRAGYSFNLISENGTLWDPLVGILDPAMNPEMVTLKNGQYVNFSIDILNGRYKPDYSEEIIYLPPGNYDVIFYYRFRGLTWTSNTERIEIIE